MAINLHKFNSWLKEGSVKRSLKLKSPSCTVRMLHTTVVPISYTSTFHPLLTLLSAFS